MTQEEHIAKLLMTDAIEIRLGRDVASLVDGLRDHCVPAIRGQLAFELGFVLPGVRLRDDRQLGAREYVLLVYEREVGRFQLQLDRLLAVASAEVVTGISGRQSVVEPAYGLDATWIEPDEQAQLETLGFAVVPPLSVIQTHLHAVVLECIDLLLTRDNVLACLEGVRQRNADLYDATMRLVSISAVHALLRALLRDRVSIKRIDLICEWIVDYANTVSAPEHLAACIATRMSSFDADIESRRARLAGSYRRQS